jgi:hypothetical protein
MPTFIHAQPLEEVNRCHGSGRGHPCTRPGGQHEWGPDSGTQGGARCRACGRTSTYARLNHSRRMAAQRAAVALSRKYSAERDKIFGRDVKESNNCHNPGGSPVGGRFCSSAGGASGSPQHLAAIQKARDYSPTVVGITSYTPGRTNRAVFSEIHDFEDRLRAIPTVINIKVSPALGAYKGAWEPSWSVYYEGNGTARKLMAHMGQKYGQQNVVIFKAGGTEPLHDLTFDRPAGSHFIKAMNRMLGRMGFGGWTWFKQGGKSVLRMGYVPEWPTDTIKSPDDFRRLASRVSSLLEKHGRTHRVEAVGVKVEVFGKENYEKVVRGHA